MALTEEAAKYWFDKFEGSLYEFVKYFLGHFLESNVPNFHKEIYKILPDSGRLLLAAPRGFAKSTIVGVFYPLWCICYAKHDDITIISASEDLATERLRAIKHEIENNKKIKMFFGDMTSNKWSETHFVVENKVFNTRIDVRAKGAGGQIRGYRPSLVILDDIETDDSVASEDRRRTLRNWIFKACLNTLKSDGQFIMIGTIISYLALINEFLETKDSWEKRKYQAYKDGIQKKGHELWADEWPHKKLQARKKDIGSFAFSTEFMNDPIADEQAPIKPNQVREWEELPDAYSCVISVDPAYSQNSNADYKVASVIGIDKNDNRYLITYLRTHKPTGQFIDGIFNLYLQYKGKITGLGIPAGGTEKEFYNSVIQKAESRSLYPPITELKNVYKSSSRRTHRKKTDRIIAALQPLFEAGKYYIHKSHAEAKDELLAIGASRWDDIVDSMAYAEQIIQKRYIETETAERDRYGGLKTRGQKPVLNYGY